MKYAAVSLAAFSLLQLASAQPYQKRHAHQAAHVKKGEVVQQVTNIVIAEATAAAEVIVYVDQDGKVLSTNTIAPTAVIVSTQFASTSTPTSTPTVQAAAPPVAVVAPVAPPPPATNNVVAPPAAQPAAQPVSASGHGFSYSPYSGSGACKSAAEVLLDISSVASGFGYVRTYGVDCNTISTVLAAAKANNLKLLAGIFSLSDVAGQISSIIHGANGDWSDFEGITIGNELVNSGQASPSQVVAAVSAARSQLRGAGYNGPVSTVDTLVATVANPELCDHSDVCSVNCHPFFDPNTAAQNAGEFITNSIATLKSKLANPGQTILISETGWPHKGSANGKAVPSPSNQAAAISSIKSAFAGNPAGVVLFTPFNDAWKKAAADTFYAEQFWGFVGDSPSG